MSKLILARFASRKFVLAFVAFLVFAYAGEYEKAWSVVGGYLGLQGLIDHKHAATETGGEPVEHF